MVSNSDILCKGKRLPGFNLKPTIVYYNSWWKNNVFQIFLKVSLKAAIANSEIWREA